MYILGTSYFVTPLLGAGVHAGIEVCVVEDDGVCIKQRPNCRAAAVGQDAAEHLPVPVKFLHILLQGHNTKHMNRLWQIFHLLHVFSLLISLVCSKLHTLNTLQYNPNFFPCTLTVRYPHPYLFNVSTGSLQFHLIFTIHFDVTAEGN